MKPFSKPEIWSIGVIFMILVVVCWPNFNLSLRRARDQVRRDDIGNIQGAIDAYYSDYGVYPSSTSDGRMIACKASGSDIRPGGTVDLVPCDWGKDSWINLTPGVNKTYLRYFPGDPHLNKGVSYAYFSDGSRYQLYGSLEGVDEPGYDLKLVANGFKCGKVVCNIGRAHNVPLYITIEQYNLQIHCIAFPKDIKCNGIVPAND
jgi:type II secretory pathway pseudopilin PulG